MVILRSLSICLYLMFVFEVGYGQCKLDSMVYFGYNTNNNKKELISKVFYYYNVKDSLTGIISQSMDVNGKLLNVLKRDYILDSTGKITKLIESVWNNNTWKLNSTTDIELDVVGNEIVKTSMLWSNTKSQLTNFLKGYYTYNSKREVIQVLTQAWDSVAKNWYNYQRIQVFDSMLQLKSYQLDEVWNKDSGQWGNESKYESNLYADGMLKDMKKYDWYCWSNPCIWINYEIDYYYYDQFRRDTAIFAKNNNGGLKYIQRSYYNTNGCKEMDRTYKPLTPQGKPVPTDETLYYYHMWKNSTLMENEVLAFKVYPNPTSDFLNLENVRSQQYELIDSRTGKRVMEGTIVSSKQAIDISNLANGLYLFRSGTVFQKIIINH